MKKLTVFSACAVALLPAALSLTACTNDKNVSLSISISKEGVPMQVECEGRRDWPEWKSRLVPAPGFVGMDVTPHSILGSATIPCHADEGFCLFMHARHMPVELRLTFHGPAGERTQSITLTGKEQPVHRMNELESPEYCVYYISTYARGELSVNRSNNYTLSADEVAKCEQMRPMSEQSE